jgi:hypothetical protein
MGALTLRASANHDWWRLRKNTLAITDCAELRKDLEHYAKKIHGNGDIFRFLSGPVQAMPETLPQAVSRGEISAKAAATYALYMGFCMGHIDAAADLCAGRVLHETKHLVLHYRYAKKQRDAELCLSFRSDDGFLSFYPFNRVHKLSASCVRSMRSFVRSYCGPLMAGELSPHNEAARLCRLIGLQVRDGYGFLEPLDAPALAKQYLRGLEAA